MGRRKKLVTVLAIVAGAVLASLILLYLLFPTDLIRDRAVAEMEKRLGRPVHVGGARLAVLPTLGADLTDVRVGERAEPGRPRLALASLRLRVRLLPLLRREVVITRVEIKRPEVEVVMAAVGGAAAKAPPTPGAGAARTGSAPEKAGQRSAAAAGESAPGGAGGTAGRGAEAGADTGRSSSATARPFHFKVDELAVSDGRVLVRKADGAPFVYLAGISEELKAEATSAGDLNLSGHTLIDSTLVHLPAGDLGQGLRLRLDNVIRYTRSSDSLRVEKATLDLNGLPVSVTGTAASVSTGHPTVDLSLKGGPGEVSDILAYLPSAMFPEMEGVESSGTLALHGSITGPLGKGDASRRAGGELDFNLSMTLSDGRIVHPKLPAPVDQVNLQAAATPRYVDVSNFSAASGKNRVKARAKISDYQKDPVIDAALEADLDLHEVAAMHPSAGAYQLQGRTTAQLSVRGPAKDPNGLEAAGIVGLSSVGAKVPGLEAPVEDVNGRVLIQNKDLTVQELSLKAGSTDLSARGTLTGYGALMPGAATKTPAKIDLVARSGLLALNELMPSSKEEERSAAGSAEAPASPAQKAAAPLAALTGMIDFSADKVRTSETETGAVRAIVTLDRGLIHIERLDMQVFGGEVAVAGTVDYRTPATPKFDLESHVKGARASDLLASSKTVSKFSRLGGFLVGDMNGSATFKGGLDEGGGLDIGSLTSIGDLDIRGGEIVDQPLQVKLADFLEAPQLKTISITDWYQPFRIEGGRLNVDGLNIKSKQVEVSATGWQSVDGQVQMGFDVLLPRDLSGGIQKRIPKELVPVLFDSAGSRVLVPLSITGTYDSPRVSVDTDRLTSQARAQAERRLAAERKRLEEEAKLKGQGLLEGLLKTPSDTTESAKKTEELEKKIKDSLKDLFKKK